MSEREDQFMNEIEATDIPVVEVVEEKEPEFTPEDKKLLQDIADARIPKIQLREGDNRETL